MECRGSGRSGYGPTVPRNTRGACGEEDEDDERPCPQSGTPLLTGRTRTHKTSRHGSEKKKAPESFDSEASCGVPRAGFEPGTGGWKTSGRTRLSPPSP